MTHGSGWLRALVSRKLLLIPLSLSVLLVGVVSLAEAQTILRVDVGAPGLVEDGATWGTAYRDLQDALAAADAGGGSYEIWVAEGTYKPSVPAGRDATFQLKNGVALYGGFAGTEDRREDREGSFDMTILSGDLAGDDGPDFANRSDNSYHVVTGSGTDATAVLDGFSVRSGNADWTFPDNHGAGMYNDTCSPRVTNCTFSDNLAIVIGGGMYNRNSSPKVTHCTFSGNSACGRMGGDGGGMGNWGGSPTVENCTFSSNSADWGGGMCNEDSSPVVTLCAFSGNEAYYGGGMSNRFSNPTVTDCTFSENIAGDLGGGMSNTNASSPTVVRCTFSENSAARGGGMGNWGGSPTVENCTFSSNSADWGGGMCNLDESSPTVVHCTFSGNSADSGGGMRNSEIYAAGSSPTVRNTILAGNTPDDCFQSTTSTLISSGYNLEGGTSCGCTQPTDQQDTDPLLDPLLRDNGGSTRTHALLPGSPALDAIPSPNDYNAAPPTDQRGVVRPQGTHCDIGAFEQEVSKGDTTGDGSWDLLDVVLCQQIASGLVHGTAAQRAAADVDDDGDVDADDVKILSEYVLGIRATLP